MKSKISQPQPIKVYEPSKHLSRRKKLTEFIAVAKEIEQFGEASDDCSSPFIHLLSSPAVFMTLVPADRALNAVAAIKEKYEKEMGKVRDRLPIHVGIVYAPHRTPMRALLEAGRRMLEMPGGRETWNVKEVSAWDANNPTHLNRTITFENGVQWEMPLRMGDNATADRWYPYLLTSQQYFSAPDNEKNDHLKHVAALDSGDKVQVRPSRFDFEFLDVAGRRNEISYTSDDGRRRGLPARPFLLEELDTLNNLWDWMVDSKGEGKKKLTTSQLQRLEATLTTYIREWFNGDVVEAVQCETFQELSQDVLHRLDPAWWKSLGADKKDAFNKAVSNGLLLDVLELRMHILKERPEKETNLNQREKTDELCTPLLSAHDA